MADPLTITTGVIALLSYCGKLVIEIKLFSQGTEAINATITGLLSDIDGFKTVVQALDETFSQPKYEPVKNATGHLGSHWKNVARCIEGGGKTVAQFYTLLRTINREKSVLNDSRKYLRLKGSTEHIAIFRSQLQSYRDTLQLSMHTIILWNQTTLLESTDRIIPNLEEIAQAIDRLAKDFNSKMTDLEKAVASDETSRQLSTMATLRDTLRSSAHLVSDVSTSLVSEADDKSSIILGADTEKLMSSEASEAVRRWISSESVNKLGSSKHNESPTLTDPFQDTEGDGGIADFGSEVETDSDLDVDLANSLFKHGREKYASGDFASAERLLRNCLSRLSSSTSKSSIQRPQPGSVSRADVLNLLYETYDRQKMWLEASRALMEKISITRQSVGKQDRGVLEDTMLLVEVFRKDGQCAEARLYGRQVLRAYRRFGVEGYESVKKILVLLVEISREERNIDEEDAYSTMLQDVIRERESTQHLIISNDLESKEEIRATKPSRTDDPSRNTDNMSTKLSHTLAKQLQQYETDMRKTKTSNMSTESNDTSTEQTRRSSWAAQATAENSVEDSPTASRRSISFEKRDDSSYERWSYQRRYALKRQESLSNNRLSQQADQDPSQQSEETSSSLPIGQRTAFQHTKIEKPTEPLRSKSLPRVDRVQEVHVNASSTNLCAGERAQARQRIAEKLAQTQPVAAEENGLNLTLRRSNLAKAMEAPNSNTGDSQARLAVIGRYSDPGVVKPTTRTIITAQNPQTLDREGYSKPLELEKYTKIEKPAFTKARLPQTNRFQEKRVVLIGDPSARNFDLVRSMPYSKYKTHFTGPAHGTFKFTLDKTKTLSLTPITKYESISLARSALFSKADVIVLTFDIGNVDSWISIAEKWAPEVHEYYPRTPTVLVGTNEESRHSWDFINISSGARWRARPVTKEEGEALAAHVGALKYLETASKDSRDLLQPFAEAASMIAV